MEPNPFWNASTSAPAERLRGDLELLPQLAEAGLCEAAKDISMAGAAGTALMLLEGSRVGGIIDVQSIPRPDGVPLTRWLQAFPSFGFVLSVRPEKEDEVLARIAARGIAAARVGSVQAGSELWLCDGEVRALLWDHCQQPFVGA
jgi:selenophosphate synthetase-related protein